MLRVSMLTESEIGEMYKDHVRISEIAKKAQVTRQAIWSTLKRLGIHEQNHGKIEKVCPYCETKFLANRSRDRVYCSIPCYNAHKDGVGYYGKRGTLARFEAEYGKTLRKSRGEARKLVRVGTGEVVHHIDQNPFNNAPENLMVFRNHAEHMQYHAEMRRAKLAKTEETPAPERKHHLRCQCDLCMGKVSNA